MIETATKPFLTIGIQTYNRCESLRQNLEVLLPQMESYSRSAATVIEILIADNASSDTTASFLNELLPGYIDRGLVIHYKRHAVNIGPDENTVFLIREAQGQYLWFLSDDDIVLPGGLDYAVSRLKTYKPNLAYANYYSFVGTWQNSRAHYFPTEDRVYGDTQEMIVAYGLSHFSAVILELSEARRFLEVRHRYIGFSRLFVFSAITTRIAVEPGTRGLFLGKRIVAARLAEKIDYSVLKVCSVDWTRHLEFQYADKLFTEKNFQRKIREHYYGELPRMILNARAHTSAPIPSRIRTHILNFQQRYIPDRIHSLFLRLLLDLPAFVWSMPVRLFRALKTLRG